MAELTKRISTIVRESYETAIPYVNTRTVPSFYDGLKPSQRRTIYAMLKIASKSNAKVSEISGMVTGQFHPHGSASIDEVVSDLVHKGILIGQGNHGKKWLYNQGCEPGAPRYIEAKLHPSFTKLIGELIEYCPMEKSEVRDSITMPSRLITPIPISAITGSKGIGLAANTNIPAFSAKSLLEAYLNNDYKLLRSTYGVDIVSEKSAIKKIWEVGHGKITYAMKVYRGEYLGLKGTFMEGNADLFKPNLWKFSKYVKEGHVVIYDLGDKIFVGKNYNVRRVTEDWIYTKCKQASEWSDIYMITCNRDGVIGRTSMYKWVDTVYRSYINYYQKHIERCVKDRKDEIYVLKNLKSIGELFMAGKSDESIAKKLDLPKWVIENAGKKSINMLRKDHSSKIKSLKEEIKNLESIDIKSVTNKLINKL